MNKNRDELRERFARDIIKFLDLKDELNDNFTGGFKIHAMKNNLSELCKLSNEMVTILKKIQEVH